MGGMQATLRFSRSDPLLFAILKPDSGFEYALACVFVGVLAVCSTLLRLLRNRMELELVREPGAFRRSGLLSDSAGSDRGFPWGSNSKRGVLAACLATVDFSLMLIVMTCNTGYFLSAVTGYGLGMFAFGHLFVLGPNHEGFEVVYDNGCCV